MTQSIGQIIDSRENNFTLLRLFAALLVIYGHSYPIMGNGTPDIVLKTLGIKFAGGVAVNIFFIVSGFLIASSWQRSTWHAYLISRTVRIFPALIVCLLLTTFVMAPLVTTNPSNYFFSSDTWDYFFYNVSLYKVDYFISGVFEDNYDPAVNGSLWSLPIEFRLYIFVAVIGMLRLLSNKVYFWFFLCLLAIIYTTNAPILLNMDHNFIESTAFFLIGILTWVYRYELTINYSSIALVLFFSILFYGKKEFYIVYFPLLTIFTFYLALYIKLPKIERDLSYGVYLYGWPVQQLFAAQYPLMQPLLNALFSAIICLLIANLSWTYIEKPALNLKRYRFNTSVKNRD